MNKIAIAFLTKDRVELSRRTIEPLLQPEKFDLWWIDGSETEEGRAGTYFTSAPFGAHHSVRGGADAAVAYALTLMLTHSYGYTHIGLVENDVLLAPDWFDRTFSLFEQGKQDGLEVGAVSARAYEDRILCQLNGYALMHNLGWGQVIFTRQAAQIALKHFRTGNTTDNRRLFAQLTGKDIGAWWAFRANDHPVVADWNNDRVLAAHGLASLALTPSPVEMIGQVPSLAEQGLVLATGPVEARRDAFVFDMFVGHTRSIREETYQPGWNGVRYRSDEGLTTIFAHQVRGLDASAPYEGEWRLRNSQGFGPFAWRAAAPGATFETYVSGACDLMVSGGLDGGEVEVLDLQSGYICKPRLPHETQQGQVMHLQVPANVSYRKIRLVAHSPGISFFGLRCREPQPERNWTFDHSCLPPP